MCIFSQPTPPAPPPPPAPDSKELDAQRRASARRAAGLDTQLVEPNQLQVASTAKASAAAKTLLGG